MPKMTKNLTWCCYSQDSTGFKSNLPNQIWFS